MQSHIPQTKFSSDIMHKKSFLDIREFFFPFPRALAQFFFFFAFFSDETETRFNEFNHTEYSSK